MNKKKLYESIMESISRQVKKAINETIDFNNSDIFNKEESYYDDSNIIDNYTYNNIVEKLKNGKQISNEEYEYVYNFKYKVSSKKELKAIVDIYSKKNPTGSLNWIDTSQITDMSWLFAKTRYNGDISDWDVSNVTTMECMFDNAHKFNSPIGDWNVSNVKNMYCLFYNAESFNQPIGNWNVSNVNNMYCMFWGAKSFNQPIGNWNINKVANLSGIFNNASSFNQDISNWNVSNIKYIYGLFKNCPIEEKYKPKK